MSAPAGTRIKICCIRSEAEIDLAVRYGATALGFVSAMPSGAGIIDEELIARLVPRVPPGIGSFLLTCETSVEAIVAQHGRLKTNTIQLCDALPAGAHRELSASLPGISIVQVIHVTGEPSVEEAFEVAPHVHGLLLDSGNPALPVKELGGTGRVHDWTLSRRIVEQSPVPVYLAGGLRAANVGDAIRQVRPFGVDLCTGVRIDGALDEAKLAAFVEAVSRTG